MNDSLVKRTAILSKLRPAQITLLVDILRRATVPFEHFVESVYNEQAKDFHETLQFLTEIGWVDKQSGKLALTKRSGYFHKNQTHQLQENTDIIEAIVESSCPYQDILADYLIQFQLSSRRILFRPSSQKRLEMSIIRNFLMEAGVVSFIDEENGYELNEKFAHIYLWAKNTHGATSKAEFLRRAEQNDQLGVSAEIAVLEYERQQVGVDFCAYVIHVSAKNPGANYDIQSLRVDEGRAIKRYIEVKAVPANTLQFYWSAAEVEAASLLGHNYFLYLVPAVGGNRVDLSRMEIIENPYQNVYQNAVTWEKEENVIVCRRRPHQKSS